MDIAFTAGAARDVSSGARNVRRSLWTMLGHACIAAAATHCVFLLLFAHLGLTPLMWMNIASVGLFVASRALLLRRRNSIAVALIACEVVLHAVAASALLGWDSGFHYYMLTLVGPLALGMHGGTLSKLARLLPLGIVYAALDGWTRQALPAYRLDPALLDSVRYFNIAGMLGIMAFVSLSHYRMVVAAERALRTLASTDPLTGLHNRRHLLEIVRAMRGPGRATPGLFLLLCDIDHFKHVNDRHGHEMGDLVLERVASAVIGAVRATDSVARWGGEEFVVLLPGVDLDSALQTGERIRAAVAALALQRTATPAQGPPAAEPRSAIAVTITVGIARVDPVDTIDAAIARADAALYRGKAAGRDRVVVDVAAGTPAVG